MSSSPKKKLCERANHAWEGFHRVAKVAENMIPAPYNIPIQFFTAVSDVLAQHIKNKEDLDRLLQSLTQGLQDIDNVLGEREESDKYDLELRNLAKETLPKIMNELEKVEELHRNRRLAEKIFRQDRTSESITSAVMTLRETLESYDRRMAIGMAASVYQLGRAAALSAMRVEISKYTASNARFNASGKDNTQSARTPCTRGTRIPILNILRTWARYDYDTSAIYWLSGPAGTGKSTIAYTICQDLESYGVLGASFFCSREYPDLRARQCIIPTILRQLLDHCHAFRRAFSDVRDVQGALESTRSHVEKLLISPWRQAVKSQPDIRVVVVIDALDEVEHDGGVALIEDLITTIGTINKFPGLKFLITSRSHPAIVDLCKPIDEVYNLQEISPSDAREDIRLYLHEELQDLRGHYAASVESIIELSSGLFIYAATMARYVNPPGSNEHRLTPDQQQKRFQGLSSSNLVSAVLSHRTGTKYELLIDSLYRTIIDDQLCRDATDEERTLFLQVLYAVATTRRPLSLSELTPLVIEPLGSLSQMAVRNNVHKLHAVMSISSRGNIRMYHKSFADFLLNQQRCPEHAEAATSYFPSRAQDCLAILDCNLKFNIAEIPSSFLLDSEVEGLSSRVKANISTETRYSCLYWAHHLASVRYEDSASIRALGSSLIKFYKRKVLFWMEAMHLLERRISCREEIYLSRIWGYKLHNSELNILTEAADRLWSSFADNPTNQSTPHLYISSLSTELAMCAMKSVPLQDWKSQFHGLPAVRCQNIQFQPALLTVQCTNYIYCVAFSPDSSLVAAGLRDKSIQVWQAATGTLTMKLRGHSDWVHSIAFSPDGDRIVSGSADGTLRVWDVEVGSEVAKLLGHEAKVFSVAFSPDGARVASGSSDCTLRLWDPEAGSEVGRMNGHDGGVSSIAFSSDGSHIASGSGDNTLRVWEVSTNAEVAKMELEGHGSFVTLVAFSPNGASIASASTDLKLRIWDVATGATRMVISGHKDQVRSIAFLPNGTHIASGSDDKTVRIWEVATGAEVVKLEGHYDLVTSIALSSDGTRIASGSLDRTLRIWEVAIGSGVANMAEGLTSPQPIPPSLSKDFASAALEDDKPRDDDNSYGSPEIQSVSQVDLPP